MKSLKHIATGLLFFIAISITAQQGINYKALIKDGGGNVVANQTIDVRFTIIADTGPTEVYLETHTGAITDANGIVILNIGDGTTSDVFTNIAWGSDVHSLKVEIDIEQDASFVDMGTTQFMAVPYALSAANAATKINELSDGKSDNDGSSVFLGLDAGLNDDASNNKNVGVGFNAFYLNTSGNENTAIGAHSLFNNTIGIRNTANGFGSLFTNSEGNENTAFGGYSLYLNTTGNNNTAIGFAALYNNTIGTNNTAHGYYAGFNNISGSANVFIGNESGYNETNSNTLYIENTNANTDNALIYGEFGSNNTTTGNILRTNSEFQIGNPTGTGFAFPTIDGTASQVLLTNGNGSLIWVDVSVPSGLEALNEGNGIGWRLVGRDPANYGNIGSNSVDLSYSTAPSSTRGATGGSSIAMGRNTIASGYSSSAIGEFTIASKNWSTAMGNSTTASGTLSTAMGFGTRAQAYNSLAIGRYNVGGGDALNWGTTDELFEVGNGTNDGSRNNAFTILKNGTIIAPSFTNSLINTAGDKALITKEYADTNYNAQGLEALDEGNGLGWRLVGRDPANYGNIGLDAVDLSENQSASTTHGATGGLSLATGGSTTASGTYSMTSGVFTIASGSGSASFGIQSEAIGSYSLATGNATTATGKNSIAMGESTKADSYSSLVIGRYNIGGGTSEAWLFNDELFEIGIGTGSNDKQNAMTVLKSGNVGIGIHNPTVKLQVNGTNDASLSNGSGLFVIGAETTANLVFDRNEIIARNNGATSNLHFQTNGGDVYVGGGFVHSSDRRLKQDIENVSYGLNEVLKLNPVSYHWRTNPNASQKSLGFIAQEVQPLIKDLVSVNENRDNTLALDYNGLIPVLVKAIQQQQEIIDSLQSTVGSQKSEINSLTSQLAENNKTQNSNYKNLLKRMEQLEITNNQ